MSSPNLAAIPGARRVGSGRSARPSHFELTARAEKVARLMNVLDRVAVDNGLDPILNAGAVAIRLASMPADGWVKAAKIAHVNAPSEVTIAAVVEGYNERARLAREVRS